MKEGPCNQPWNKLFSDGLLPDSLNDMQIMSAQQFSRNKIRSKINEFGPHAKLILGPKYHKWQAKLLIDHIYIELYLKNVKATPL